MKKYARWYKFQNGIEKFKNWVKNIRYGKIGPNKGIESQRGNVDGFVHENISRKQNGSI